MKTYHGKSFDFESGQRNQNDCVEYIEFFLKILDQIHII